MKRTLSVADAKAAIASFSKPQVEQEKPATSTIRTIQSPTKSAAERENMEADLRRTFEDKPQEALGLAKRAADENNWPEMQYLYADMLMSSTKLEHDCSHDEEIKDYLQRSAENSYPKADVRLGDLFCLRGQYEDARMHYEKAESMDEDDSLVKLGRLYRNGEGVESNESTAFEYFEKAADHGDDQAQFSVGVSYFTGRGVKENLGKAFTYSKRAADQGHPGALNNMGAMYYMGKGVCQDQTRAFQIWNQAAKEGKLTDKTLQYLQKKSVQGISDATNCLKTAAEHGSHEAKQLLGKMYLNNKGDVEAAYGYFKENAKKAYPKTLEYLKQAAIAGDEKALACLNAAAEEGSDETKLFVANMYLNGDGVKKDWLVALIYLKQAAKNDNLVAFDTLGRMYAEGDGDEFRKDENRALASWEKPAQKGKLGLESVRYLTHAASLGNKTALKCLLADADNGDAEAQFQIATVLLNRVTTAESKNAALGRYKDITNKEFLFDWCKKAANNGHPMAQEHVGRFYLLGQIVPKNEQEAYKYLRMSAQQGVLGLETMQDLERIAIDGDALAKIKGLECIQLAADRGNVEAQATVGSLYFYAQCVEQDIEKAVLYYKKAAEEGNTEAQNNLALIYADQRDETQAFKYCQMAAQQGSLLLQTLSYLVTAARCGEDKAFGLIKLAADRGDAGAQAFIGENYLEGEFTEINEKIAFTYLDSSASAGHADAMHNLGIMYKKGQAVDSDIIKATRYWHKAASGGVWDSLRCLEIEANEGNVLAQYFVADIYQQGILDPANPAKASGWFKLAADLGYAPAQYRYGVMLFNGSGVSQDKEVAMNYLNEASKGGDADAQSFIKALGHADTDEHKNGAQAYG